MKILFFIFILAFVNSALSANQVEVIKNQLHVNGVEQPQLFGAEIQYFRLRGGQGKNIPREKVLEIWNRALDHAVEAGMNSVSFYIPWDFHEYKEGHFDFDGTVDEDKDGLPDYPSRDVLTFMRLIKEHGIHRIMARPGPYINAEWGFLGFGAIPLWFHQKYPDSHMKNSSGLRTKLYDYHNADFLRYTRLWFEKVYTEVLKDNVGENGPILFLQLDNETNFMWQSIFNHDYGPNAVERYQDFLRSKFIFIEDLNSDLQTSWTSWDQVIPPMIPGLNIAEDRSWYQFQDYSIYTYLQKLRKMWEDIGVTEPHVIFTMAESYNAMKNGLLPNFEQKNSSGKTGMMTMNLYPKTYELPSSPLMNLPFKADHDVLAMDKASDAYLGSPQEWLLGPEIQGGWWRNTPVSSASRQQTYLSALGHGLKALFIYYFSEGDNWQAGWARDQIKPLYDQLRTLPEYTASAGNSLPSTFWKKLQEEVDHKVIFGMDVYRLMNDPEASSDLLFFDAPLDHEARPKQHFALVRDFGQKVIVPYQNFLSKAVRVTDPVVMMKSVSDHAPSSVPGIDSMLMNAEWAGGLLGYLAQAGISADIHHWGLNDTSLLKKVKIIFHQDSGSIDPKLASFYSTFMQNGGTVVATLGNSLAQHLNIGFSAERIKRDQSIKVHSVERQDFDAASSPLSFYQNLKTNCRSILWHEEKTVGFKCSVGTGSLIQIGVNFYDIYNSDWYGLISDNQNRVNFLKTILESEKISVAVKLKSANQATAFARIQSKEKGLLWITVKNGRAEGMKDQIIISQELLDNQFSKHRKVYISELLNGKMISLEVEKIKNEGIPFELVGYGSEVFILKGLDE